MTRQDSVLLIPMLARYMTLSRVATGKEFLAEVAGETSLRDYVPGLDVLGQVGGDPGDVGAE